MMGMTFWEGVLLVFLSPALLLMGWLAYLVLDYLFWRVFEWLRP